jgi:hypothetical protein
MRKLLSVLVIGAFIALSGLAMAAPAGAHVHGVTPLECTPANANAGANRAFAVVPEGVLFGLIPRDVGNAPLEGGGDSGGNDAAVCDQ